MKYIYDDPRTQSKLSQWTEGQTLTMASFFFWISGNADQCSQTGLLRSLLHHLLDQHRHLIRDVFSDLWETLNVSTNLCVWSLAYASKALKDLLARNLGKIVLFIDGLDEYHGDHAGHLSSASERPEYYREIVGLIKSLSSPEVKICFSSRPLQVFHTYFDGRPKLRLQDLTYKDIATYVKDTLEEDGALKKLRFDHDWDLPSLISSVTYQAEGVFLWVVLVVRSLLCGIENYDDIEDLRNRLESYRSGLMALYRHMLKQIEPSYLAEGRKICAMTEVAFAMTEYKNQNGRISSGLHEELCMIGIWFGLRYSSTAPQKPKYLSSGAEIAQAIREVDRKLKTKCAGLLEAGQKMYDQDLGESKRYHELSNVLLETKYGNRRVQYIHRSTQEFLDLEMTKALLQSSTASGYNPKIALLWSTVQRIRIFEPEPQKYGEIMSTKEYLMCLADSALLLAQKLQEEGEASHIHLIDQLDVNLQLRQPEREVFWVVEAMFEVHKQNTRYIRPWNSKRTPQPVKTIGQSNETGPLSEKFESGETEQSESEFLDPQFGDDFLSLAIVYGLSDYVESKILENPLTVKQKVGRPYLDYALGDPDLNEVLESESQNGSNTIESWRKSQ